jgi:hypothetical protein
MDKNTLRNECEWRTYSCHSAASRVQLSTRDVDTRDVAGRFANKKIMHRASSMSRTASMKVGYLNFTSNFRMNVEIERSLASP